MTLPKRFYAHKTLSKNKTEWKVYKHINDNGGWDAWRIILVEAVPQVRSRDELLREEERHREAHNGSGLLLNKFRCSSGVSREDLTKSEYDHQYHERFKKESRERRKEEIRRRKSEYYQKNRDHIQAHSSERVQCECGEFRRRGDLADHRKTQQHRSKLRESQSQQLSPADHSKN